MGLFGILLAVLIPFAVFVRKIYSLYIYYALSFVNRWFYRGGAIPTTNDEFLIQPAYVLAAWIREGKATSDAVVSAFIKRAKSTDVLNAIVDNRFNEAMEEARNIDQRLKDLKEGHHISSEQADVRLPTSLQHLKDEFPLLGVPFTCKESIKAIGLSNTGGLYCRKDIVAYTDAEVVSYFKKAGAVLICVTNVPELGLWYETSNVLFGTTKSPYDIRRTSGGSSGGEAALMAVGGTPLSIGTDIGGSLRFPAYCCGVFSHKPSSSWVPLKGSGIFPSKLIDAKILVTGPIARYTDDLITMMEVMAPNMTKHLRTKVKELPLKDVTVWWSDSLGNSPLLSPVDKRLVKLMHLVKDYLTSEGATVKKYIMKRSAQEYVFTWFNKIACDYPNEPPFQSDMTDRKSTANLLTEWAKWCTLRGPHTFPCLSFATIDVFKARPIPDPKESAYYWQNLQSEFMETMGPNSVLLLPTMPIIAPFHNEPIFNAFDFIYCGLFNAIEFPATQVPLGFTKNKLPVGIQVVTTPANDHVSLAVSLALEQKFGGWQPLSLVSDGEKDLKS